MLFAADSSQGQHPYARETQDARIGNITYKEACLAIYARRYAVSSAYPFSARILGHGTAFLYMQGTLCVLNGSTVKVWEIHLPLDSVELELASIIRPVLESEFSAVGDFNVSLLYYSDGILAVHVTREARKKNSYLFAIDTTKATAEPPNKRRVISAVQIAARSKLFVRHTARYLYYGMHTGLGDDGHHKWEIEGISLDPYSPPPLRKRAPLLLEGFHGTDIGSTVAFEIHNDYFYAVSNQCPTTFEADEKDYPCYYHWLRFPLSHPVPEAVESNDRLYRRQHSQGPIHDSWTDLSLQVSERTGETVIVEARREWKRASSRQSRSFYVTELGINRGDSPASGGVRSGGNSNIRDKYHDVATLLPLPQQQQHTSSPHTEFVSTDTSTRSFNLARTKFRAYSYACTSFLDLVEDDRCCSSNGSSSSSSSSNNPTTPLQSPCLRLRIGSRRAPAHPNATSRQGPTLMWPPPAHRCPCARRLHAILTPQQLPAGAPLARSVTGVWDGRTLVYMVGAGRGNGAGTLVGTVVAVGFTRPDGVMDGGGAQGLCVGGRDVDYEVWEWTPGLEGRCRAGICR